MPSQLAAAAAAAAAAATGTFPMISPFYISGAQSAAKNSIYPLPICSALHRNLIRVLLAMDVVLSGCDEYAAAHDIILEPC